MSALYVLPHHLSSPMPDRFDAESVASSSYAGSAASVSSGEEFPLSDVARRIEQAFETLPLDRALVLQAQLSGRIHSAEQELVELSTVAAERLPIARAHATMARDLQRQISADLDWIEKRVRILEAKARTDKPIEYAQAVEKVRPGAL